MQISHLQNCHFRLPI